MRFKFLSVLTIYENVLVSTEPPSSLVSSVTFSSICDNVTHIRRIYLSKIFVGLDSSKLFSEYKSNSCKEYVMHAESYFIPVRVCILHVHASPCAPMSSRSKSAIEIDMRGVYKS